MVGGGIGSGGGSSVGGAGCSGVLGAIMNDSLELNMVIRAAYEFQEGNWFGFGFRHLGWLLGQRIGVVLHLLEYPSLLCNDN